MYYIIKQALIYNENNNFKFKINNIFNNFKSIRLSVPN